MLELYLSKADIHDIPNKNYIKYNDIFFDDMIDNNKLKINDNIKKVIKLIDGVDCIDEHKIVSKYQKGIAISIKELSTGCKTALNIVSCANKEFTLDECGDNAIQVIFNFKRGKARLTHFVVPRDFKNDIKVHVGQKEYPIHNEVELLDILYDYFNEEQTI